MMHYTDILLFQGDDPDGISDATSRLLAVLHGINRAHGNVEEGNPLAIAFPRWQAPTSSAHQRLSGGTTGPILRVFGPDTLLSMLNAHKLMHSLMLEGRADPGKILTVPTTGQWVCYRRYLRQEKTSSGSYQKRHHTFLEKKASDQTATPQAPQQPPKHPNAPYIYLSIPRPEGDMVTFPVTEAITTDKPEQPLRANSWGLTLTGGLPYF
ncbi:MAG: type I-F CRISPR-associated endoribonuclease Cas6/Csy4 [Methylovulum sp.]|nr:type I-F CRISPR-associated endoribonuclease Cas6/Csy4 [Methylovulum sp.]